MKKSDKCSRCNDLRAQPDNYCKPCRSVLNREWRLKNPERKRALNAKHNAKRGVFWLRPRTRGFVRGMEVVLRFVLGVEV